MRDYLTHLIVRGLGRTEVICPRPIGLFETPPSSSKLAPKYHSNPETMEEEQAYSVTPEAPSVILSSPRTNGPPRLSATGAQGDFKVHQHQGDNSSTNSRWLSKQPTGQQLTPAGSIVPQSPEVKTEPPQLGPAESESPSPTARQTGTNAKEQRPRPSAIYPAKSESSEIAIQNTPQESVPDELISPPRIIRRMANTISLQNSGTQQNEAKFEMAIKPDISERPNHLKASHAPTFPFPEPRPIHSATIEPALTRLYGGPHMELTNKVSAEPVINITIGRIEVRATQFEAQKQPRRQRKPSGVMSLDTYLQQRTHGGNP